jgi:hypothetical protein
MVVSQFVVVIFREKTKFEKIWNFENQKTRISYKFYNFTFSEVYIQYYNSNKFCVFLEKQTNEWMLTISIVQFLKEFLCCSLQWKPLNVIQKERDRDRKRPYLPYPTLPYPTLSWPDLTYSNLTWPNLTKPYLTYPTLLPYPTLSWTDLT